MNLRELITTLKGNRTYTQLAADCGGQPSDKRLQQLGTQKQKNFPDPDTIKALAKGLRVSDVTVVLAAAEDLDLDVSRATPKVLDYLPAGVNDLDEDQLFAIGNMLRSFIPVERQDEPTQAEKALAAEVVVSLPGWGPMESEEPASDQGIVDNILRQREEYEQQEAARKPPLGGSKGRRLRRDQDEAETGSQDPGGPGGDA